MRQRERVCECSVRCGWGSAERSEAPTRLNSLFVPRAAKMAAASSMQPPTAPAVERPNSPGQDSESPESRPEEDGASEDTILRDMAELEPEEIERRLEKTRRELSNRRKIVIKNLPQDATNQVQRLNARASLLNSTDSRFSMDLLLPHTVYLVCSVVSDGD